MKEKLGGMLVERYKEIRIKPKKNIYMWKK